MKLFIVAVCLMGVAYAEVSLQAVFQAKWNSFKAAHGKAYSRAEEPKRLNAFLANTMTIETHNERHAKGLESYTLSHNHLSDLTVDEFKEKMLGLNYPGLQATGNATAFQMPSGLSCPASVSWAHMLGPVKNQQDCGSCYAYASLCPLEACIARKTGQIVPLSEQEIVDCTNGKGNSGCNGGWMDPCYNYIIQNRGLSTEASYPYKARVNTCQGRKSNTGAMKSYSTCTTHQQLKQALCSIGPVAVALQAGVPSFQMYKGGVYNDARCGKGNIDHGVAAIGYGTENGIAYYIIRNSWGLSWGEQGCMKIATTVPHVEKHGYYPNL